MPVTDFHESYLARLPEWQMINDCLAGRAAMIRAGKVYVPPLSGHKNDLEYQQYLQRGSWYGALAKTAAAFIGQIYRRTPVVTLTPRLLTREDNVDNLGSSIYTFTKNATFDVLTKGRYGLLVDMEPDNGDRTRTPAPFMAGYNAESIRNWRYRVIRGVPKLDQVILQEIVETPASDGYGSVRQPRFRVLELDAEGYYNVHFWYHDRDGQFLQDPRRIYPRLKIGGEPIDYIPFVFMGPRSMDPNPQQPPMLAMAEANIDFWRFSIDLNSGLHRTAFPVPWIQGVNPQDQHQFFISESIIWLLPAGASAEYLEFRGDGLQSLERALERVERYMAKLGAQMLEDKKRVTETAEALNMRSSGETASLADIAMSCSESFTAALRMMAGLVDDDVDAVQCTLNTDFEAGGMSSQDLLGLVTARTQGLLTMEDYAWNLQRGEIVRPGQSLEEIVDNLEKEKPVLLGSADPVVRAGGTPATAPGQPMMRQPGGVQTSAKTPRVTSGTTATSNGSQATDNR
jgi:hypothetical protein